MYDRAPRDLTFKVGSTPAAVGPGSYETDHKSACRGDGYAPFLSMSSRDTHPVANDQVVAAPGPGHYDVKLIQDEPKGRGPLANRSKRFSETASETPGPGAYHCHKYLELGHKPKSAPGTGREEKMVMTARIKFHRKPEAPSIPSHLQTYGYEECDDGTLKRQEPPQKDTTLGPAYYSPIVSETKATQSYKGIHFGKLSSRRLGFIGKAGPGPGAYDPYAEKCVTKENANLSGEENFRHESRLPRYPEVLQIQEEKRTIPGPGSYEIKSSFQIQMPTLNTEGIEVDHPPFLSQSKRFTPVKSTVPPPGTYNDPRTALEALNRITGLKRSPFSQTSVRFNQDTTAKLLPGPGAYNIPGFGEESMRKAYMEATRKGVFGTTSSRSQPLPKAVWQDIPGPGHYKVYENTVPRYPQLGSNFASVTRRLKSQENDVPPPGSYDVVTAYEKCLGKPSMAKPRSVAAHRKHNSFLSSAPRFASQKTSDIPGPASYNAFVETLSKKGGIIAARDKRFLEKTDNFPGPGTYELSPLFQDTVLKGSFNHTLGNPLVSASYSSNTKTANVKPAFLLGV